MLVSMDGWSGSEGPLEVAVNTKVRIQRICKFAGLFFGLVGRSFADWIVVPERRRAQTPVQWPRSAISSGGLGR